MRLVELEPQWLQRDGNRVGIMFRCPHCRETWLTCFSVGMRIWGEEVDAPHRWAGQMGYVRQALDLAKHENVKENAVVPCDANTAWAFKGDSFENLSITPSLDAGKAGHWHGFITNGEIQ